MSERVWRKASASIGMSNCVEVARPEWIKAAASGSSSGCVEMRLAGPMVGIRDSKHRNAAGEVTSPVLEVSPADFATFISGVKAGEFNLA